MPAQSARACRDWHAPMRATHPPGRCSRKESSGPSEKSFHQRHDSFVRLLEQPMTSVGEGVELAFGEALPPACIVALMKYRVLQTPAHHQRHSLEAHNLPLELD